jgi:hypothetical protein
MVRALTIRFAVMCVGVTPLIFLGNALNAPPVVAFLSLLIYMVVGVLIIGNYCIDHEDEIPTRAERRRNWRG